MSPDSRQQRIGHAILDIVERHDPVTNKVLFSCLSRDFPDLHGREYAEALTQLRELGLIHSFDGGYDKMHEITREGACMLTEQG